MGEIEFSVLARQCLNERMESRARLETEVAARQAARNSAAARVDGRSTTAATRTKIKHSTPLS